jgi:hypothetical protein
MYWGRLALKEKHRTPLATGETKINPHRFSQYGFTAKPIAGVQPIDLPMTMMRAGGCFNLDTAKSNIAKAAWCMPASDASPVLKP